MTIRKENGKYVLRSKKNGRKLGSFKTRKEAIARERQINFFKRRKS